MKSIIKFLGIIALIAVVGFFLTACGDSGGGGGGDEDTTISLSSAADLAKIGSSGFPLDGEYKLTGNITLTNWMPIGLAQGLPFTGTFNGGGYTVTLNSFDSSAKEKTVSIDYGPGSGKVVPIGIFGHVKNANISNMTITLNFSSGETAFIADAAVATQQHYVGGVVGSSQKSVISNITVNGSLMAAKLTHENGLHVGGIAGQITNDSIIKDCISNVEVLSSTKALNSQARAGGITGLATGGSKIEKCYSTGNVSSYAEKIGGHSRAGGIAGGILNGVTITDCSSTGTIYAENTAPSGGSGNATAGGIAGLCEQSKPDDLADQSNMGDIRITRCFSSGDISGERSNRFARVGGIAGHVNIMEGAPSNTIYITHCYSTGKIESKVTNGGANCNARAGGIAGEVNNNPNTKAISIQYCYSTGNIKADGVQIGDYAVGIAIGDVSTANCVALNKQITTVYGNDAYRIGSFYSGTGSNNMAYEDMLANGSTTMSNSHNNGNGRSINKAELINKNFWENEVEVFKNVFSTNWKWITGYPYPALIWQNSAPAFDPLP